MAVYDIAGISRQGHFRQLNRLAVRELEASAILEVCGQIREEHPMMSCRKMYDVAGNGFSLGRDRFEALLLTHGFRVRHPKNYQRTTYSVGHGYFDNLISGLVLTGIDQLWQTDITYFRCLGRFYYMVFIIDVYSRRIIGYHVSDNMLAYSNMQALRMAFGTRGNPERFTSLIHHSDRGSQYVDKDYVRLLKQKGIAASMCLNSWENAFVERVHGTIKNEYMKHRTINSFAVLKAELARSVKLYNQQRPHLSLPGRTPPARFEQMINQNKIGDYQVVIYDPDKSTNPQLSTKKKEPKKKD